MEENRIYLSKNIDLLKKMGDSTCDIIYGDILYNTGKTFNDYCDNLGDDGNVIDFYIPILQECYRVLKNTGVIVLQMDFRINYLLRLCLNRVFGKNNFVNELVWCYNVQGYSKDRFSQKHDTLLVFSKTSNFKFNLIREGSPSEGSIKRFLPEIKKNGGYKEYKTGKFVEITEEEFLKIGHPPYSWFTDINVLPAQHKERRFGKYDTQKPEKLLEKIILAFSDEGSLFLDIFNGSGTGCVVAKRLNRRFIGCDISTKSIEITNKRLNDEK